MEAGLTKKRSPQRQPVRQNTTRPSGFRWDSIPLAVWIVSGAAILAAAVFFVALRGPSGAPSGSSSGAAVGATLSVSPQPATTGQSLSLDQYRGSKVVVYFYEGSG